MNAEQNHSFYPIEKLTAEHEVDSFDCGKEELNRFLKRFALMNQRSESSQTYIACLAGRVVAYCSLTVGSVLHADAPERIKKGLPRYPIPVMILARLAVDDRYQGKGLGKALLKNALLRKAQAADIAGIRALLVHAKDEEAFAFYRYFNFDPGPTDPYRLFLVMKEIKRLVARESI
ncbi:MAG: N-acetyltransferase [Candidatus Omnitrophota bacterium]|nr:MAG: N-acetyltransferase [Candidatus Omnitrophota bacterium]